MKPAPVLVIVLWCVVSVLPAAAQVPSSVRSAEVVKRVTPALENEVNAGGFRYGTDVFIRIFKEPAELEVWLRKGPSYQLFKTFNICTYGFGGLGPKQTNGDGMAPEGFYAIGPSNLNPVSRFHLALNVGYPNAYDRSHRRTGSAIMIHGDCVSIGCFAMTNPVIETIYALADAAFRNGQRILPIHIFPFRMTGENLSRHTPSDWLPFWRNLKEGYDAFEKRRVPPVATVREGVYSFTSK
jgi:murein L,D-transpeptidase YafK